MPDHHLHSYFRYIVAHPHLLKDGTDAGTSEGNKIAMSQSEHAASSSGALSLLGAVYESGDEDDGVLPASSKSTDPGDDLVLHEKVHKGSASHIHDKEVKKEHTITEEASIAVKDKPFFTKKNPAITGNSITAAHREKVKGSMMALTTSTKSENTKLSVSDTEEVILEPPSFMKGTVEKIVEFIIRNGKEFEEKLIAQDRMTGRFSFLLPNNPYHSYYLKILQETQESKSRGGSSERKDRSSLERRDRGSSELRDRRSSSELRDRRSSSERKDSGHGKEVTKSKGRGSANKDSSASDRTSAEPSEKQLNEKGKFHLVSVKKEPPRKVTADEAAAIVMAATRGLGPMDSQSNTLKDTSDIRCIQDPRTMSKPVSNSGADTSLTSSGQLKKEATGIIDDDWIANTIAKAVAVAASKEADSSEASMTNEQKMKAERLRRARMFTAIIKSGGSKSDLVTSDPVNESAKVSPADLNLPGPDTEPLATEREGSSAPFEREGSNMMKQDKDSDDEQNKARKYRKHHPVSDEDKDDLEEESYKHSRKRHRSERSRGHSKDAHRHKHRHSMDREYRHQRHSHSSSEDERRSSKSRHRHRHDHDYAEDDEHRHRRSHGSGYKRKHKDDGDPIEQTLGRAEASQSTAERKYGSEQPPSGTAQSSHAATEVPDELKAKIRAMLLETL
uniref:Uncharacterized protein n=1 Tax=Avena sativa TaxID=4498 RepID=A0ACD5W0N6_AVESA